MITLTAKINLLSDKKGTLTAIGNENGNNISSEIRNVLGKQITNVNNPFILGASKLGDGSTLSGKVNYFIGNRPSNENGKFNSSYNIYVSGKNITVLNIAFDTVNNRHPNNIRCNGVIYADDDAIFTITNLGAGGTIYIDNWNTPLYPLVITGIYVNISIDIDYRRLISLGRDITYRGDNKLPSYGIISNTGNLEFNDLNGEIKDYAEQLLLKSGLKVVIMLNNTLTNNYQQVGIFETETWDYDNDNRSVSVSLKDDLEEWQDIQVQGFDYDPRNPNFVLTEGTMADLYSWLWDRTPSKYQMKSYSSLDNITKQILATTHIDYPMLKSGTLWEQWQKLCEVCELYIYKDNQGNTICTYTIGG